MNLIEKATLLNQKLREEFPATPGECGGTIKELVDALCDEENKDIWYLIELIIWKAYGLYYKEYRDWNPIEGHTVDVFELEKAIDLKLESYGVVL